ncbi:MAG TPA: hypothetical protein VJ906_02870, partial [Roseovarius sp.]|nr:hypothetical protein [Roseovarius sp.]
MPGQNRTGAGVAAWNFCVGFRVVPCKLCSQAAIASHGEMPVPVILENHKIAFFNVPKAASTSVKHAFHVVLYGKPYDPADYGGRNIHKLYKVKIPVTREDIE